LSRKGNQVIKFTSEITLLSAKLMKQFNKEKENLKFKEEDKKIKKEEAEPLIVVDTS